MLKSLMIQNFAIIDEIQIEFSENMSVLTGETGAGKSIIIDAISLLMGSRATSFMVKNGTKKAFVEGVFDVGDNSALKAQLVTLGFDLEDELVISREISAEGKSQARLNYRNVSAGLLKEISHYLADIHSQFETQYLLNDKNHLSLLDQYIMGPMTSLQQEYAIVYQKYLDAKKAYEALLKIPRDEEQIEYLRSKMQEIEDINLQDGEIDALEDEKKRMSEYEKSHEKLTYVLHHLNADNGAIDALYEASHALSSLDDNNLKPLQERLSDLYYQLNDISEEIKNYQDDLVFDEYRYEEIQNRLFLIRKLQRQYGYEVEDILAKKEEFATQIEFIENREALLQKSEKKLQMCQKEAINVAEKMRQLRKKACKDLEKEVLLVLKDLYMENTRFVCQFNETKKLTDTGMDSVSFLISTNVGGDLQKLSDVASGGELSRLMLGLKCIFAQLQGISTIIFDEVDTGVSGKVAFAIGRKMKSLAKNVQVICITHLPQVASFAQNHLFVYKHVVNQQTRTEAKWLNKQERIEEIAKMLSNDTVNQSALDNARYLLEENGKN